MPVTTVMPVNAAMDPPMGQSARPYSSAKLAQIRWYGIVSLPGPTYMRYALTPAKISHPPATSALARGEAITNIAHCLDGVGRELVAKASHVNVHDIGAGVESKSPDVGQQFLAGADLAAPVEEMGQERELALGQRNPGRTDPELAPLQIEVGVLTDRDPRLASCARRQIVPEPKPDPREQFGVDERLQHEIGRARLEDLDPWSDLRDRGQDQHSGTRLGRHQDVQNLRARDIGQVEVRSEERRVGKECRS